jgi:hypothetical protein
MSKKAFEKIESGLKEALGWAQTHCADCEVALTLDERRYYGDRCEDCERHLNSLVQPRDQFMEGYKRDTVEGMAQEMARLRKALEEIDAVAVSKKAGASVKMQRIAREALALSRGDL